MLELLWLWCRGQLGCGLALKCLASTIAIKISRLPSKPLDQALMKHDSKVLCSADLVAALCPELRAAVVPIDPVKMT